MAAKTLLKAIEKKEHELYELNVDVPDRWLRPPKAAMLKLNEVKALRKGKLHAIKVVPPQTYNTTYLLKRESFELDVDEDTQPTTATNVGLFHTGQSGIAQTGDGGDGGDLWWIVNDSLIKWLQRKLAFLKRLAVMANKRVASW